MKTRWFVPSDRVPEDKETVVLRVGEEFHLAIYEASDKAFILTKDRRKISISEINLLWMSLTRSLSK
jgi:hypothetical protein